MFKKDTEKCMALLESLKKSEAEAAIDAVMKHVLEQAVIIERFQKELGINPEQPSCSVL